MNVFFVYGLLTPFLIFLLANGVFFNTSPTYLIFLI